MVFDNAMPEFTYDNGKLLDKAYNSADNRSLDELGLWLWEACKREAEFATEDRMEAIKTQENNIQAENELDMIRGHKIFR